MSVTVTQHLEGIRARVESERGSKLVVALDTFVQKSSESRTQRRTGNTSRSQGRGRPVRKVRSPLVHQQTPPYPGQTSQASGLPSPQRGDRSDTANSSKRPSQSDVEAATHAPPPDGAHESHSDRHPSTSSTNTTPDHPQKQNDRGNYGEELHAAAVESTLKATFQRACGLLQRAIDVDELVFLDASVGSWGGLAKGEELSEALTDSGTGGTDSEDQQQPVLESNRCRILGQCHVPSNTALSEPYSANSGMSEAFLKTMLRRYPDGNIWNFDSIDESTSSDDMSHPQGAARTGPNNTTQSKAKNLKKSRRGEVAELQRIFPEAKNLCLFGLWDYTRNRWYAACVLWTSDPIRLFASESEMNFVAAFCDVITAEVHNREVERSDKAKATFISSISHELRSPLHGILGSAEVLHDQPLDDFSQSMVAQITACGKSLRDIIENLLDFSQINYNAKHGARKPRKDILNGLKSPLSTVSHPGTVDSQPDSPDIRLDDITEEVVQSVVAAYLFNQKFDMKKSVTTILDIENPLKGSWNSNIEVGAWRRVVQNLLTNALKCTAEGHIYVTLRTERSTSPTTRLNAVLTVQDTGKGMSQEFVDNELFAAFSQEDTFLEGTGLGMHIVARIVQSLNGKIGVQTDQKGGGTSLSVTVPLEASSPSSKAGAPMPVPARLNELTAGIFDCRSGESTTAQSKAQSLLLKTVTKSCHRQGIETARIDRTSLARPRYLNIITEEDLLQYLRQWEAGEEGEVQHALASKPLIVLCKSVDSERHLRSRLDSVPTGHAVGYVVQPCGPARVRETILSVFEREGSFSNSISRDLNHDAVSGAPSTPLSTRRMPVRAHTTGEASVQKKEPSSISGSTNDSTFKIMVVEDNIINLQLLLTYARKQGLSCIKAEDGKQAFEAYKLAHETTQPDVADGSTSPSLPRVILMDINMPTMNGFQATTEIRGYERLHGLKPAKILALTGLGSAESQREAYACGFDLFLSKPVRLKELTKILEGFKTDG
ncbi:uncharacterized protein LTR77_009874 [Saxophila tyrrhenica]|uniref:Uncharacterized protein n=1 Tax=Saxophila tyrrhenica TaxID=1690608 RepID=A0AAV9NY65_9PEZI|nr:hypothetical protein LTR77_009874 [Saxophila tyrrhenica]